MELSRTSVSIIAFAIAIVGFIFAKDSYISTQINKYDPIRSKALLIKVLKKDKSDPKVRELLKVRDPDMAETLYLPDKTILRMMSLGWESFAADMLFIRAHEYLLSHLFFDRRFPWLLQYYQAIKALDPYIPRLYLWVADVLKLGQNIDNKLVFTSVKILEEGLKYFPEEPKLYEEIGFNLYFEYHPKSLLDRQVMRIKGREFFSKAASLPGSDLDPNFVAQLYMEKAENKMALYYALSKYFEATKGQKEQLLYRISMLGGEIAVNLKLIEQRWKQEFPYINPDLFALVGSKIRLDKTFIRLAQDFEHEHRR